MTGKKNCRYPMCLWVCVSLLFLYALVGCGAKTVSDTAETSAAEKTAEQSREESFAETESSAAAETVAETTVPETSSAEETAEETEVYPYDFTQRDFVEIENFWEYAPKAKISGVKEDGSYFKVRGDDGYGTCQGSCTDGTYVYMFLQNARAKFVDGDFISMCILFKIDMESWEVAALSEPLEVDHGNSITYNPKLNMLVTANATPNNHLVSKIDPETLTVTEVIEFPDRISSITYNASRDQYAVQFTGTYDFGILDADFQLLERYPGVNTTLNGQNIDNDDEYIYIMNTSAGSFPSAETIAVYDWEGNYLGFYRIDSNMENEGMFNYNGEYYMTFNNVGGRIYRIEFDKELLGGPFRF